MSLSNSICGISGPTWVSQLQCKHQRKGINTPLNRSRPRSKLPCHLKCWLKAPIFPSLSAACFAVLEMWQGINIATLCTKFRLNQLTSCELKYLKWCSAASWRLLVLFVLQIYFYASYVFKEAGISNEKIQYITIGTGTCEFTACIMCVSGPVLKLLLRNRIKEERCWHTSQSP